MLSFLLSRLQSRTLIAIDWSDRYLRIVVLKKKAIGQYVLEVADCEVLEAGIIENNQIIDFATVAETLIDLLKRNKVKSKKVGFVLSSTNVISKTIQIDKGLNETQLKDAILLDFNKYVSYPVEDTFFDFKLIPQSDSTSQALLLIAAHKDHIEQYQRLAKICRLSIEVIDVDSYVLQRYMQIFHVSYNEDYNVLVCLNYKRFKIHIFDNDNIYLAEHKSVSASLNEEDYLNTLSAWLIRNLQMFDVSNKGKKLERLMLYGDRVEIDNLTQVVKDFTGLEAIMINPFTHLLNMNQAQQIKHGAGYVLTVGLATREGIS
ncbi:type IV pilus biogenesis protein PilM [Fastidiosibacter lacustris]|uniref:type IV pilus biogenesis protein PilM n=1 Tax=Fastidiosibacter lacustris TaxID=2056695 RepID=UPI0018648ACE|nr:pilus assembly protein PilM [Fastidiosibacter lacustris]